MRLRGIEEWAEVSTHSRAEAAAFKVTSLEKHTNVSTHSRAEAAAYGKNLDLNMY